MEFAWDICANQKGTEIIIENGDWGRDIVGNNIELNEIISFSTVNCKQKVEILPRIGVIYIEGIRVMLGFNHGNYGYFIKDCDTRLIGMAPFKTAILSFNTKRHENLEKHLMLKYSITSIEDKVSGEISRLESPIEKTFLIYFKDTGIAVC